MGIRIFVGNEWGAEPYAEQQAVLISSSTGTVIDSPIFDSPEQAEMFLEWSKFDVRLCGVFGNPDMETHFNRFCKEREDGWKTRLEEREAEERAEIEAEIAEERLNFQRNAGI